LELPWPPNLSLKELVIWDGRFPHLAPDQSPSSSQIYSLVNQLGPSISYLEIEISDLVKEPLDVSRVLAACPGIQNLVIYPEGPFKRSTTNLKPEHFASYKTYNTSFYIFISGNLYFFFQFPISRCF